MWSWNLNNGMLLRSVVVGWWRCGRSHPHNDGDVSRTDNHSPLCVYTSVAGVKNSPLDGRAGGTPYSRLDSSSLFLHPAPQHSHDEQHGVCRERDREEEEKGKTRMACSGATSQGTQTQSVTGKAGRIQFLWRSSRTSNSPPNARSSSTRLARGGGVRTTIRRRTRTKKNKKNNNKKKNNKVAAAAAAAAAVQVLESRSSFTTL
ncbi:uncharacterized protein CIMG_01143 [Coccidioides immitis RS]|uniref:Uncharacterized protein n=1 Tax=Coccidioides immitis (strain RS) TaxID=246410 RepID=J3KIJ1_COCIM|nr:uncharacterized protein CIMG_01143 [Coccidioides immitis RS]EAS35789.3 hypothetical protein CIMG_01143 [Coccidioides immitis RS]